MNGPIDVVSRYPATMTTKLWWLSFCDAHRPKGTQFLGACLVEGTDLVDAIAAARTLGLNPGGEVAGVAATDDVIPLIRDAWKNRLLTFEECHAFDKEMIALQDASGDFVRVELEPEVVCQDHNLPKRGQS